MKQKRFKGTLYFNSDLDNYFVPLNAESFGYLMFRWDNLGVLGLVCRLYSEREENDKNDDDVIKSTDVKNKEDCDKTDAVKNVNSQRSKFDESTKREKDDQGVEEEISFSSDNSEIENDENEDDMTLFSFENEFLWDEVQ